MWGGRIILCLGITSVCIWFVCLLLLVILLVGYSNIKGWRIKSNSVWCGNALFLCNIFHYTCPCLWLGATANKSICKYIVVFWWLIIIENQLVGHPNGDNRLWKVIIDHRKYTINLSQKFIDTFKTNNTTTKCTGWAG